MFSQLSQSQPLCFEPSRQLSQLKCGWSLDMAVKSSPTGYIDCSLHVEHILSPPDNRSARVPSSLEWRGVTYSAADVGGVLQLSLMSPGLECNGRSSLRLWSTSFSENSSPVRTCLTPVSWFNLMMNFFGLTDVEAALRWHRLVRSASGVEGWSDTFESTVSRGLVSRGHTYFGRITQKKKKIYQMIIFIFRFTRAYFLPEFWYFIYHVHYIGNWSLPLQCVTSFLPFLEYSIADNVSCSFTIYTRYLVWIKYPCHFKLM